MLTRAKSPAKNTKTPARLHATSTARQCMFTCTRGAKTKQYEISMKLRKKVEMLFAHLKRILGMGNSDCAAQMAQMRNYYSLQPPKSSANSPRFFLHRSNAKSLKRKPLVLPPMTNLLRPQRGFFQQNGRIADFRCALDERLQCGAGSGHSQSRSVLILWMEP